MAQGRRTFTSLFVAAFLMCVLSASCLAGDIKLTGSEAVALGLAVDAFKQIYAKPDLRHYTVQLKRRGKQLEVTFVGETPKTYPPGTAGTGGGSSFGPDMTYVVALDPAKIVSSNFYR